MVKTSTTVEPSANIEVTVQGSWSLAGGAQRLLWGWELPGSRQAGALKTLDLDLNIPGYLCTCVDFNVGRLFPIWPPGLEMRLVETAAPVDTSCYRLAAQMQSQMLPLAFSER
jgi:hypothetical protein